MLLPLLFSHKEKQGTLPVTRRARHIHTQSPRSDLCARQVCLSLRVFMLSLGFMAYHTSSNILHELSCTSFDESTIKIHKRVPFQPHCVAHTHTRLLGWLALAMQTDNDKSSPASCRHVEDVRGRSSTTPNTVFRRRRRRRESLRYIFIPEG